MRVIVKNHSSKKRSKKEINTLRNFASKIAKELNISKHISYISINYKDDWTGYYPEGKPLAGFFKAWNGKRVTIDLVGFWDKNLMARKEAIVHELTHAKQMITKDLVVYKTGKTLKWKGKVCHSWKEWRMSKLNSLSSYKKRAEYHHKLLPWEKEVEENINFFLKSKVSSI